MKPRPVLPNRTYLVTRRCSERRYFLLPLRLVNQLVSFCLAYAASRWGMKVHAFCALAGRSWVARRCFDCRLSALPIPRWSGEV